MTNKYIEQFRKDMEKLLVENGNEDLINLEEASEEYLMEKLVENQERLIAEGKTKTYPAKEVFDRLRKKYGDD